MRPSPSTRTERLRGRAGQEQRKRRLRAHGVTCSLCGKLGAWHQRETSAMLPLLVVDHVIPLTRGGTDTDDNIRVICEPCHVKVGGDQFGHRVKRRIVIGPDGWPVE